MKKTGRNDPCPCGSGKKFKKCCERKMIGRKYMAKKLDESAPQLSKSSGLTNLFQNRVSVPTQSTRKLSPSSPGASNAAPSANPSSPKDEKNTQENQPTEIDKESKIPPENDTNTPEKTNTKSPKKQPSPKTKKDQS